MSRNDTVDRIIDRNIDHCIDAGGLGITCAFHSRSVQSQLVPVAHYNAGRGISMCLTAGYSAKREKESQRYDDSRTAYYLFHGYSPLSFMLTKRGRALRSFSRTWLTLHVLLSSIPLAYPGQKIACCAV